MYTEHLRATEHSTQQPKTPRVQSVADVIGKATMSAYGASLSAQETNIHVPHQTHVTAEHAAAPAEASQGDEPPKPPSETPEAAQEGDEPRFSVRQFTDTLPKDGQESVAAFGRHTDTIASAVTQWSDYIEQTPTADDAREGAIDELHLTARGPDGSTAAITVRGTNRLAIRFTGRGDGEADSSHLYVTRNGVLSRIDNPPAPPEVSTPGSVPARVAAETKRTYDTAVISDDRLLLTAVSVAETDHVRRLVEYAAPTPVTGDQLVAIARNRAAAATEHIPQHSDSQVAGRQLAEVVMSHTGDVQYQNGELQFPVKKAEHLVADGSVVHAEAGLFDSRALTGEAGSTPYVTIRHRSAPSEDASESGRFTELHYVAMDGLKVIIQEGTVDPAGGSPDIHTIREVIGDALEAQQLNRFLRYHLDTSEV